MGNVRRPGGDQAATDQATGPRMTVPEAADALGISQDAVRSRIGRGTLTSVRDGGGMFVMLGGDEPPTDQPGESNALTSQMQGEIAYLREQLEAERQAHAEARRIIAGLVERMPPQLEAPSEAEAADAPETVEEAEDELGAERARRETAETTLQEGMAEERRRREEAERERDELRRELYARRESRESPETADEQQGRARLRPDAPVPQEGTRSEARPWWRRVFRG
jgi:hypothetical protein